MRLVHTGFQFGYQTLADESRGFSIQPPRFRGTAHYIIIHRVL